MLQRLQTFWRAMVHEDAEETGPRWAVQSRKFLRFWVRVVEGFIRNRCPLWASALTYSSLLAFIPMLAVILGISTSLLKNDSARITSWIDDVLDNLVPQLMRSGEFADTKDQVITYVLQAIDNVNSGAVGTTGVVTLLLMILFMLTRIEESMNGIWGVTQGRSWYKRMVNYWAAITLGPIVIVAAIGFSTSLRLGKTRIQSPTLAPADLADAEEFASRLANPQTPLATYLRARLSPESRELLSRVSWEDPMTAPDRVLVVKDLNAVIEGDSIYASNRFAGVRLRTETKSLAEKEDAEASRPRLNRLLLEDAFPGILSRSDKSWLERMPVIGSLLIRLIPIPILGGACALFYALMPNTRVRWNAAMIGGLVAGVLWYLNNTLSVLFVTQATRNRAIYNSLAAVPVFMVSLYLFWMLLLFGAQVAFTYQNRRTYLVARQIDRIHQSGRELVAMRIMVEVSRAFTTGSPPPSFVSLAQRLEIPEALVHQIACSLVHANLLVEANHGDTGFLPARPPDSLRVADVLEAMRQGSVASGSTEPDALRRALESELWKVSEAERRAGSRTLADLVEMGS